jgi:hypothetical protein
MGGSSDEYLRLQEAAKSENWVVETFERLARERKELFEAAMLATVWVGRQPTKADMAEYAECRERLTAALKQIAESDAA